MSAICYYIKTVFEDNERKLSTWETSVVIFGMSFGTAPLTMPFMASLAGPVSFFLMLTTITLLSAYCCCLIADCAVYTLKHCGEDEIFRDPLLCIIGVAFGDKIRKIMLVVIVVIFLVNIPGYILVCATTIGTFIHNDAVSYNNNIRIGVAITCCIILPFLLKGTYKELGFVSFVVVISNPTAFVLIQFECHHLGFSDLDLKYYDNKINNFYITLFTFIGTITFSFTGTQLFLANLVTNIENPESLKISFISAQSLIYCCTLFAGLFPYFMLGDSIHPSIINTLEKFKPLSEYWKVVLLLIKIATLIHFMLAIVLYLNPVLLIFEKWFNTEKGLSLKRSLIRSAVIIVLGIFCIIFTNFSAILSLVGGGPNVVIAVILPVVMYCKIMESCFIEKLINVVIVLLMVAAVIGSTMSETIKLIGETEI